MTDTATTQPQRLLSGRYELLRPLAEGGMAQLWLGKLVGTAGFAKLVAIKRILPQLARSKRFADMFLDEGRVAADLRHPNVVQVLEVGADGDELFIAMELLEGLDAGRLLSRVLARGERLPLGCAAQIALDGAAGLAYAHAKTTLDGEPLEIVHRDVSPQNLFVTIDGIAKIVDFGIVKARSQTTLTEAGTLKGKCAYMAPEQVCGDPVDHRADQFALGVVLWELIAGERLFKRSGDVETLKAVLACDVPRPSDVVKGVPAALDAITRKALDPDPERRFSSCDEMAAALDAFLNDPGALSHAGAAAVGVRGGARALARIVRERMHDPPPDASAPAAAQEKTLPERAYVLRSGFDDEPTSAESSAVAVVAPQPLPKAPPAIGREEERAAVRRAWTASAKPSLPAPGMALSPGDNCSPGALSAAGLVTLVGPAGAGKSHLARAIADEEGEGNHAWIVALDGAESGADVVTLFAFTLGLPGEALPQDLERAAAIAGRALAARSGRALVVLDGIDDILAAAAPLARALAQHVRVLATARAPLGVMGERVVDVTALAVPAPAASVADIRASPAVRLLVDAAGGANAVPFASTGGANNDWQAIAAIARGTGGMPASLLLAGRWLVEQRAGRIVKEMEERSGERALSVLLDGGVPHLSEDDRSALVRLAPHRGPLDASLVDVLVPERDPKDVLTALRDAGAVVGDEIVPGARERALDELAAKGALAEMRLTHAVAVAARARNALDENRVADLVRMRHACEDAVEVLLRARVNDADDDAGGAAAASAAGAERSGRDALVLALALDVAADSVSPRKAPSHLRFLDEAIERATVRVDRMLRARALEARADHEKLAGKTSDARRDYLLALELVEGDVGLTALLHRNIADLDLDAGDILGAETHARKSIAAARKAGDTKAMAKATFSLGRVALKRGGVPEAEVLFERAARGFIEDGDARFSARTTFEIGRCAEARGDVDGARKLFAHALLNLERNGDVAFAEKARVHLGMAAAWLGKMEEARSLLSTARDSARARGDARAEAAVIAQIADIDAATGDTASAEALRGEADGLRALAR